MDKWRRYVEVAPDVERALSRGQPIVALESAVISHGLPSPIGVETAHALEAIVHTADAVPATLAVIDGRIRVGLADLQFDRLAMTSTIKVSARDLPVAVASQATGGMTVSATVTVADLVGINVICTGGIGGVHIGAISSWDVSSDIRTLAEHPIALICAGAKAICDIGRTLEVLETVGVTVVAYQTDRFPGFFTPDSGYPAPHRIETVREAALILAAKRVLIQRSALLIANPIASADALPAAQVQEAVAQAINQDTAKAVRGGDVTPHLLASLVQITQGASLRANLALLRANAHVAAEVARAFAQVRAGEASK